MKYQISQGLLSRKNFIAELCSQSVEYEIVKKSGRSRVKEPSVLYYNVPAAFDIETSSFYTINNEKRGIMYIWQFGINNLITTGRTWDEFISLLNDVSTILSLEADTKRLIVYVHFLEFEFQWLRKHFKWKKVFLLKERRPIYAVTIGGIEFRCSYKLSQQKLENTANQMDGTIYEIHKLVGNLDYNLIRTPLTPLTQAEYNYCENDVRVLLHYIQYKIENDGDITKIPLTNTGYVRQYCRDKCYDSFIKYRFIMNELQLTGIDEFNQLRRAFYGGHTHANHLYVDKVIHDMNSWDIISSYPAVMVLKQFPMSRAHEETTMTLDGFKNHLARHCCLFDVELINISPRLDFEHPISESKCWLPEGGKPDMIAIDNGRVLTSPRLFLTVTEQEFITIAEFYNVEKFSVYNFRWYNKGYLPKPFIEAILDLYRAKTELKGVEGREVDYMTSKEMINASYGMSVTNPLRDEIEYTEENVYRKIKSDYQAAIEKYNKQVKRFLFYPWGVWVTAHARRNLFQLIKLVGDSYVYSDTDSIKCKNENRTGEYFEEYNKHILDLIEESANQLAIDIEKYMPSTKAGKKKIIGQWEMESHYNRFKTLGAKRYLTESDDSGQLELKLTMAGVSKTKALQFLVETGDPFGNFNNTLVVPEEYSGRLIITYIDDEIEGDVIDYLGNMYHYHELSSVHAEPSKYEVSINGVFFDYIRGGLEIYD